MSGDVDWGRVCARLAVTGFGLLLLGIWTNGDLQGRLLATGGVCMFAAFIAAVVAA